MINKTIITLLIILTITSCRNIEGCTLDQPKYEYYYKMCLKKINFDGNNPAQTITSCRKNAKLMAFSCGGQPVEHFSYFN